MPQNRFKFGGIPLSGQRTWKLKENGNIASKLECIVLAPTTDAKGKQPSLKITFLNLDANKLTSPNLRQPLVPLGTRLGKGSVKKRLNVASNP